LRVTCARFTPDARHIRESDANVAREERTRDVNFDMFMVTWEFYLSKATGHIEAVIRSVGLGACYIEFGLYSGQI
jgi:pyridoxine 5'-phosphate synthase PdxJ